MAGAATGATAIAAAGTAIAAGDSVKITAPKTVKKGHGLHTTIWGVASRPRSLGFTIGHKKCAANSAKNDSQETNDFGYGGVGWSVKGVFSSRVDWGSHGGYANGTLWIVEIPVTKSGYLCAYLQKGRLNRNNSPTGAVIVRASKYFKVVK